MSTTLGYNPDSNLKDYSLENILKKLLQKLKILAIKNLFGREKYNTLSKTKKACQLNKEMILQVMK